MFGIINLQIDYIFWHYSKGLLDLFVFWKNMLWFSFHLFPAGLLMRKWFSRFKGLGEEKRGRGFDLEELLMRIFVNFLMRIIGFFLRTIFILMGILMFITVSALAPVILIVWLLLPVLIIGLFIIGVMLVVGAG